MKKKVMKLVDPETGKMVCNVCGAIHWASLNSAGKYYHDSWQCQNRCTMDTSQGLVKLPI